MIYLGTPGRMIGIACPAVQRLTPSERLSFQSTLEGRVKAQVRPLSRRTWDLRLPATSTPEEVAVLNDFADGSWGRGPWWFVSADAPVVNVLPPVTSVFGGHVDGGPLRLAGGGVTPFSHARSDGAAGTIQFVGASFDPPVLEGLPVTGSAWLLGTGGSVLLQWLSASGSIIGSAQTPTAGRVPSGVSAAVRVSVTGVAPAGAVRVRLTARSAVSAARPAITWTDQPYEYGDGQGCAKAVVHGVSRDLVWAPRDPRAGRYASMSFTVQEVG